MSEARRGFSAPAEVVGYFDGKGDRPSFSWLDVWGEEHAAAWTVAKAVDVELRTVLRDAVSAGLREGRTFDNFLKDLQPELERTGWWKPRTVSDPDGIDPDAVVDFSSRRRLETIYWSNMRSARAAGQWHRVQRAKRGLPYLLYVRSSSAEPRTEHLAFVGVILPVDHPWWRAHFPPNGWGCKCSVRQISAREAERLLGAESTEGGIRYVSEPPDLGPDREFRNRRTGSTTRVPRGVDPGWHTSPGDARARAVIEDLSAKLDAADPVDSSPAVEEAWSDPFLQIVPRLRDRIDLPAGVSAAHQARLGASSPVVRIDSGRLQRALAQPGVALPDLSGLPRLLSEAPAVAGSDPGSLQVIGQMAADWWRAEIDLDERQRMRVSLLARTAAQTAAFEMLEKGLGLGDLVAAGFAPEAAEVFVREWSESRPR